MSDINKFFAKYYFVGAIGWATVHSAATIVTEVETQGKLLVYARKVKVQSRNLALLHVIGLCTQIIFA
jgi:hypothetical protein